MMPDPSSPGNPAALPAALLRLSLLAALAMAGLYAWQGWRLLPYPGDWAAPPAMRAVTVVERLLLFLLVPALIVIAARWRATRDRQLAGWALVFAVAAALSATAWPLADTLGEARALFFGDALVSLCGAVVAGRALRV